MTQEEKDILIRDLCARLPYKPLMCIITDNGEKYSAPLHYTQLYYCSLVNIKPYLFPMSSMTEGLKNEMHPISKIDINDVEPLVLKQYFSYFDWLNENHFDYRGLIKRGLAIDATGLNIY